MNMRYYGTQPINNVKSVSQNHEERTQPFSEEKSKPLPPPPQEKANKSFLGNIFNKFSKDDLILIAIIFMLLQEDDADTTLIMLLGYIFIAGL